MDMKLVVTVLVIASMPAFAEQGEVSKATVADV
jgi:flagellar basal body P-ring protein FlgI